jgi:hypothetical protein
MTNPRCIMIAGAFLIAVTGYYVMVSMTLNVAEVLPPSGAPLPLAPLDR